MGLRLQLYHPYDVSVYADGFFEVLSVEAVVGVVNYNEVYKYCTTTYRRVPKLPSFGQTQQSHSRTRNGRRGTCSGKAY
jgi:hypothetical protein